MVPGVGLEPTRVLPHRILSPARLPISPSRQVQRLAGRYSSKSLIGESQTLNLPSPYRRMPVSADRSVSKEVAIAYSLVWRWLLMSVHRYGSLPTGELLTVLTIVVLDRANYHPTVTDLSEVTQLPKSSISRYISDQMAKGFLEEYIDPTDRRRRRLRPTEVARAELREHWNDKVEAAYGNILQEGGDPTIREDATVAEVLDYLKSSFEPDSAGRAGILTG